MRQKLIELIEMWLNMIYDYPIVYIITALVACFISGLAEYLGGLQYRIIHPFVLIPLILMFSGLLIVRIVGLFDQDNRSDE